MATRAIRELSSRCQLVRALWRASTRPRQIPRAHCRPCLLCRFSRGHATAQLRSLEHSQRLSVCNSPRRIRFLCRTCRIPSRAARHPCGPVYCRGFVTACRALVGCGPHRAAYTLRHLDPEIRRPSRSRQSAGRPMGTEPPANVGLPCSPLRP